ncbi:MAG: type II secretion system F family protein [Oscillospiraceae bacterium]|nr:type II secretion system F family protein [Oscillospiraceae bacterium]
MAVFQYKAVSREGQAISGVLEAFDEFEVIDRLRQDGAVVTQVLPAAKKSLLQKDILPAGKIKEKTLAIVCSQFAIILSSGLPIVRCVELIAAQTVDKSLKKILNEVAKDVAAGHSLADSFESKGRKRLPITFVETLRAGEAAGTLDKSFERLHRYYDKSAKTKGKIASALAYPMFLLVVAVIVVIVIMTVAVPVLTRTFSSFGSELPGPTKALIAVSNFMTDYWYVLAGGAALLIIAFRVWVATEKGRLQYAALKLRLPVLGRVFQMKNAGQFAATMSTMLAAGLPMVNAVSITGKILDNYLLGTQTSSAVPWLEEGHPLGEYMRRNTSFPDLLNEMTAVGEETGAIESTLDVISDFYDNESETATARALSLLEPAIICVLAIVVVFILLAVYMAMFTMYDGIV